MTDQGKREWVVSGMDCAACTTKVTRAVERLPGVEVGRVNVAARACGLAWRGFELAIAYAQQRETFGKPIWK